MSALNDFAVAVRDAVAALQPDLTACDLRPGPFTDDELTAFLATAPAAAIVISGVGVGEATDSGLYDWPVKAAVYIAAVAEDESGETAIARDRVWSLLNAVAGNGWGLEAIHPPASIQAENLTDAGLGSAGTALWAVTWEQKLRGGTDLFAEDPADVTDLYIGMAPDIGAGHEDDYFHVALGDGDAA